MTSLLDSEDDIEREALAAWHEDRRGLHAAQTTRLTIHLNYDAPLGRWFAVVTDTHGHVLASFSDWSSLDVLREAALVADRATVAP